MTKPINPNQIILKNKFYPKGLTEEKIWNHYISNKSSILNQLNGRNAIFVIFPDINKPIIRRKLKNNSTIRLNSNNYNKLITGRTVTIYGVMNQYESFGILDIDCQDWRTAKISTMRLYEYALKNIPIIHSIKIKYTGKSSFHLICNFGKNIKIDTIRYLLQKSLENKEILKNFTVNQKSRNPKIPNIDLSPNKLNGGYIIFESLSILGLKCVELDYADCFNFQKENVKIK
jgi:hypothetical protein